SLTSFPGTFFVAGTHAERPRALQRPVAVCSDVIRSTGRSHAASPSVGVAGLAAQWIRVLRRRSQRHRERAGQRVMGSITRFITHRPRLKVNQAKSAVARPWAKEVSRIQLHRRTRTEAAHSSQGNRWLQGADSGADAENPRYQSAADGPRDRDLSTRPARILR